MSSCEYIILDSIKTRPYCGNIPAHVVTVKFFQRETDLDVCEAHLDDVLKLLKGSITKVNGISTNKQNMGTKKCNNCGKERPVTELQWEKVEHPDKRDFTIVWTCNNGCIRDTR